MRNAILHRRLEQYVIEASGLLTGWVAAGAEMPFELRTERGAGNAPLSCYRPLVGRFIRERRVGLSEPVSHAGAVHALAECEAIDLYLTSRGELRIPGDRVGRAALALETFLCAVYAERSEFGFEPAHFEEAFAELERTVYADRGAVMVIAPLFGVALEAGTTELTLGEGLSLIRGEALAGAPAEAVWGQDGGPAVLVALTVREPSSRPGAAALARMRFRRLLSALRLFAHGRYGLGPLAWAQTSTGGWRVLQTSVSGRTGARGGVTTVPTAQAEELRAFWRLLGRGGAAGGEAELTWALARFEMGCERAVPLEALTDYLVALRALLEPEGPASGRLAQRLAVICAGPPDRAALARRTARAVELEREVISGIIAAEPVEAVVEELADHLRAMLRDALCGHLDADLCAVADELLAEAAQALAPAR